MVQTLAAASASSATVGGDISSVLKNPAGGLPRWTSPGRCTETGKKAHGLRVDWVQTNRHSFFHQPPFTVSNKLNKNKTTPPKKKKT